MEEIKFDPSMFINPPYKKCPKCGQEKFGILSIYEQSYVRRCCNCYYPRGHERPERFELPELNKKVVYLDQFVISEMVKAKKDPHHRKEWVELYNLIDKLVLEQIIVCPDSDYHRKESELHVLMDGDLKKFYEQMSRGITFKHPHNIESLQIHQSLKKFVDEDISDDYDFGNWHNAFNGNPNTWLANFHMRGNISKDLEEVEQRRLRKEEYLKVYKEHFEDLPTGDNFDFPKEVNFWQEVQSYTIFELYSNYIKESIEIGCGLKPFDPTWLSSIPSVVMLAKQILSFFEKRNIVDKAEQIKKMKDFLYSKYFYNTPYVLIYSLYNAGISRKFVYGARKEPKSGDFYDVKILSRLLPYCDAMFIDNEARAIATEEPINLNKRYDTRLFSNKTKDDFIAYLRELEAQTSPEIRKAVISLYGEK